MPLAHVPGGLASWTPLYLFIAGFVAIVSTLEALGTSGDHRSAVGRLLLRIPNGLERLTGIPGWAAAMVGTSIFALALAGQGFYADVAWHIYTGRDKNLLTAPHSAIVLGLTCIGFAALLGVLFASLAEVETRLRFRRVRIPWSALSLGLLGVTAMSGFPLDDLWHLRYGVDVTMWSPTHMLMIMGASLSPLAAWLALAEAGVRPGDGTWARAVHTAVAILTLQGFVSALGEFRFGVPQFQQLYHPVLIAIAAGFALVAARVVLGWGWALGVTILNLPLSIDARTLARGPGFVQPRLVALFVGSGVAVELAALAVGTSRRLRFAVVSAFGVNTLGLAVEWWWNRHAIQPWRGPLLVGALIWGTVAALGAAILGASYAGSVLRERTRLPVAPLVAAVVAVLVALAVPLPRRTGAVTAHISLQARGDRALVSAVLSPPAAADHARWFQLMAWQGGGLVVVGMRHAGPGAWVADAPVPVTGRWKTLLRLQRGDQMMAVPIFLPADASIPAPEIPAVDRTVPFLRESHFLLREQKNNAGLDWFAAVVESLLVVVAALWCASFVLVARRVRPPLMTPALTG